MPSEGQPAELIILFIQALDYSFRLLRVLCNTSNQSISCRFVVTPFSRDFRGSQMQK
jgi:hypothetical protein